MAEAPFVEAFEEPPRVLGGRDYGKVSPMTFHCNTFSQCKLPGFGPVRDSLRKGSFAQPCLSQRKLGE